mgnify:CR=1 FL=1
MMDVRLKKWESVMQHDAALQDRLRRLDPKGYPATFQGDLLCLNVKDKSPIVVSWDGRQIHVETRPPKKTFISWSMMQDMFDEIFMNGKTPPVLVAMNNDQKNIKAGADHHNGSLVISFMVMLQECTEGGVNA